MHPSSNKKVYLLSDFHLGAPNASDSLIREKKIVEFLTSIAPTASAIYILGDVFDFWFEYKNVVPKGFTRLLGCLAQLTDRGIPITFFVGNHDMWMKKYLITEIGVVIKYEPEQVVWSGKHFFIGHGDGLGPGDHRYKFLKKIFRNKLCQLLFGMLHPTIGIGLANYFSRKSRASTGQADNHFLGEEKEWLLIFCRQQLALQHIDYFVFGHRHYPMDYKLTETSRYINLGDWITQFTYAEFDGEKLTLKKYLK